MNKELQLPNTALPIKNAIDHWIDIDGSVYALDKRNNSKNKLIKKAQTTTFGYKYCGIRYKNETQNRNKRVHRLVAEAFLPNPNNYNIVGHKNNIKSDNRVENLYWTTIKENTEKAVKDGLLKNDKGFDDSQSISVIMFDTYTNKQIGIFGSIKEASRITGISATTISRQSKYKRPTRKNFYFRYSDDIDCATPDLIGAFDYKTDKLIETFYNSGDAYRKTKISTRTICQQVKNNQKPSSKHKHNNIYFLKLTTNKCEQTIETLVEE